MKKQKSVFVVEAINTYNDRYPRRKAWLAALAYCSTLERAEKALRLSIMDDQRYEKDKPRAEWDLYHVGYLISERFVDPFATQKNVLSYDWACYIRVRSYTADGTFVCENSTPEIAPEYEFLGRKPEDVRFHHGDIVEVYWYGYAELCIVDHEPPSVERAQELNERARQMHPDEPEEWKWLERMDYSDDAYLVYSLGEGDTHSHPLSYTLFPPSKPVSQRLTKLLKDKLEEMDQLHKDEFKSNI